MSKRDLELIDNSGGDAGNANRHNRLEVMSKTTKSIEFFAFQVDRIFLCLKNEAQDTIGKNEC